MKKYIFDRKSKIVSKKICRLIIRPSNIYAYIHSRQLDFKFCLFHDYGLWICFPKKYYPKLNTFVVVVFVVVVVVVVFLFFFQVQSFIGGCNLQK